MSVSVDIIWDGILLGASCESEPLGDEVPLCISSKHAYASSTAKHAAYELATLSGSGPTRNLDVDFRTMSSPREAMPVGSLERDSTGINRGILHLVLMVNFKRATAPVLRGGAQPPPQDEDTIELPAEVLTFLEGKGPLPQGWLPPYLLPQVQQAAVDEFQGRPAADTMTPEEIHDFVELHVWSKEGPNVARRCYERAMRVAEAELETATRNLDDLTQKIADQLKKANHQEPLPARPEDLQHHVKTMTDDEKQKYKDWTKDTHRLRQKSRRIRAKAAKCLEVYEAQRPGIVKEQEQWSRIRSELHRFAVKYLNLYFNNPEDEPNPQQQPNPQAPNDPNLPGPSGSGQQRPTKRGADGGSPPGPEKKDRRCHIM